MLSFEKINSNWEVVINGLGFNHVAVSTIQNTDLKSPKVSRNIPTVAQETQGEVIAFARNSLEKMKDDGKNVFLEGREQTVNYVLTPFRYTLVLSDGSLVGKRRAAQRLAAATLAEVKARLIVADGTEGNLESQYRIDHNAFVTEVLNEKLSLMLSELAK